MKFFLLSKKVETIMAEKRVDVSFKARGTGWKAHGHIKGPASYLECLERAFEEIEDNHEKEKGAEK